MIQAVPDDTFPESGWNSIGRTPLHHETLGQLGRGSVGGVHVAHDTKRDGNVALKVLAPVLAESEERHASCEPAWLDEYTVITKTFERLHILKRPVASIRPRHQL